MLLKDKIAVIAGDAYGIGHATALLFARQGARVICIDDKPGMAHARTIRSGELDLPYYHADVTDAAQVQAVARACENALARVDILFNVAGRGAIKQTFEHTTEATWTAMIGRNLTSGFLCAKYFLPLMKRAGSGAIINHASIDGFLGNPSIAAYSAAKGGVLPLTHVMAHDLAKYNIRVNSISTGGIRSTAAAASRMDEARVAVTPSGRMGTAEDVAPVALFLASDGAAYVNGANIVVDGGRTVTTHGCYND
ncbi:MAG TPA: SDR family oxidoreductase [Burkholderiales bacterium]|nr:SDR family oxidoreductase [Burkholderiales bacterium]